MLKGKNILITGAASGIGRETSIILNQAEANIIMLDISQEGLIETQKYLSNPNSINLCFDLTDTQNIEKAIETSVSKFGKLNGIVHCAGVSSRKPLNVLSKKGFEKVMDINFFSFVDLVRFGTKKRFFEDGGSIVVMSSISSTKGYKAKTEYCVSKAAIDAFVRCCALELAPRRIRINSILPAEVLTPMAANAKELSNSIRADTTFSAPLGPTTPEEIAQLIAFLLSDHVKTITGTSIVVDGGLTI